MPLLYRKVQDQSSNEAKNGKYYGRLATISTYDVDALCEHIAVHGSVYTADVVSGVIKTFIQCFKHILLDGYKIKLDGLGTFYLSISTIGAESAEKFTASNIKSVRLKFLADRSLKSAYNPTNLMTAAVFRNIGELTGGLVSSGSSSSGSGSGSDDPIEQTP